MSGRMTLQFVLHLVQDMSNHKIAFERKAINSNSNNAETSNQVSYRNNNNNM